VLVLNQQKRNRDEILLVNASKQFSKGRPKNYLSDEAVDGISDSYLNWSQCDGLSAIITRTDAAKNDYNLSPSRYIVLNGLEEVLSLEDAAVLFFEAEEERETADKDLFRILKRLGVSEGVDE
jgi:type I restriction enzyme M protein